MVIMNHEKKIELWLKQKMKGKNWRIRQHCWYYYKLWKIHHKWMEKTFLFLIFQFPIFLGIDNDDKWLWWQWWFDSKNFYDDHNLINNKYIKWNKKGPFLSIFLLLLLLLFDQTNKKFFNVFGFLNGLDNYLCKEFFSWKQK